MLAVTNAAVELGFYSSDKIWEMGKGNSGEIYTVATINRLKTVIISSENAFGFAVMEV